MQSYHLSMVASQGPTWRPGRNVAMCSLGCATVPFCAGWIPSWNGNGTLSAGLAAEISVDPFEVAGGRAFSSISSGAKDVCALEPQPSMKAWRWGVSSRSEWVFVVLVCYLLCSLSPHFCAPPASRSMIFSASRATRLPSCLRCLWTATTHLPPFPLESSTHAVLQQRTWPGVGAKTWQAGSQKVSAFQPCQQQLVAATHLCQ